jgi:hypothetical protein
MKTSHVLHQLDIHLTVAEAANRRPPERRLQMPRDVGRQRRIGVAGKKRQRVARRHRIFGPTASK